MHDRACETFRWCIRKCVDKFTCIHIAQNSFGTRTAILSSFTYTIAHYSSNKEHGLLDARDKQLAYVS